jgi:signal transduction histidine kinase
MLESSPTQSDTMAETTGPRLEQRKRYGRITERDCALLEELRGVVERHADTLVDRFYDHLLRYDELRPFLAEPGTVERLRGFQRDYLLSLVSGRYEDDYARDRLRIGRTHSRIGLEPGWYLGTYGIYLDLLFPLIFERFGDDVHGAVQASAALAKVMILDMQLVLDAYYDIQQQRAVAHSEQLAAVGALAASIAHEVRNPLAGMKGALEILRKDVALQPNQEIVDELLAQIVRLEHLVRDLLTYSRPSAPSRQRFDLHGLLDRLLRLCIEQAGADGVTLQRIYEPETGQLEADPGQMEQVFLNLVHNALQAMPEGGTLTVTTSAVPSGIEIGFADSGKGIPVSDLHKVDQPFFTTKHRGSGLGLSIVKKIVEAHGGSVRLTSEVGRGTNVAVIVPTGKAD